jgi:HD-GYP domain-containing protein (c-di-GMP phosphodiesterase class II)
MVSDADLLDKIAEYTRKQGGDTAIERLLANVVAQVREFAEARAAEIKRLSDIGIALSAERNLERLLERIVDEARRFTRADAGTLYTLQLNTVTNDPELNFDIMQNDTMNVRQGGTSGNPITLPPVPLVKEGKPNRNNVSAYVANTGETVNIADVYTAEGFDFSGTRKFDQITGYRTKSMLVAPMRNHENEIIGVLQLLNAKVPGGERVIGFSDEYVDLIKSLASQAAVAVTTARLIHDLQNLFESLIKLIASAIDEKSAYTGGHITRVAGLSLQIAKTINEVTDGPYGSVHLSADELNELRTAAWLHDIGKITTPEYVVDKGTKLETIFDRVELVKTRFEAIRRGMVMDALEDKLRLVSAGADGAAVEAVDQQLGVVLEELESDKEFVTRSNQPGEFLKDDAIDRLKAIAAKTFMLDGVETPYLTENELLNLSIRKGSLTEEERLIIQNHVSVTIKMLSQIPFTKKLSHVVEYAGAHHEKLNGAGYPNGWGADRLALQSRILCLADICEALTARDRPYKPAMPKERAFQILGFMAKDQEIDSDLLAMFIEKNVYDEYMEVYSAEQEAAKATGKT